MPYPRKPAALKRLEGRRVTRGEVSPGVLAKVPKVPDWLDGEARRFYTGMGRELIKLGLLAKVDVPALVALSVAWGRWVEAERELQVRGPVITTATGAEQVNPWQTVSTRALDRFCNLLSQFGGTPAARTKVELQNKEPPVDFRALLTGTIDGEAVDVTEWEDPRRVLERDFWPRSDGRELVPAPKNGAGEGS